MAKNENLIVIEQLPVITERLVEISKEIDERITNALSLACTEDTVKTVKALRAELNKEFDMFDMRRKAVKSAVMEPYERFETVYKTYVSERYKGADAQLKTRIDEVEDAVKAEKRAELSAFFYEYCDSKNVPVAIANMERWAPNITLSVTLAALRKSAALYIDTITDDLALIATQEHSAEILVEYEKQSGIPSAAQAITAVVERHKRIAEATEREAAIAANKEAAKAVETKVDAVMEDIGFPVAGAPAPEPMKKLSFTVQDTVTRLRALKKFLDDGGYIYE